jgi:hypothetical protein
MIDPRICKDPITLIRFQKKDGSFLYTGEECLRLLEVYLDRAKTVWIEEKIEERERPRKAAESLGAWKPTGRGRLFWTDSE